ncbi:MAG: substrate-binding domain-containing protein, partial [Victivallales bacterium]
DLSIIGTDDMSFSKMLRPALTTIKQPKGEQGKIAAQLMNAILNKKSPENVLLEPELIIRDSCRKYVKP